MRVLCPYCNVEAQYVDSRIVYNGWDFGMIYLCSNYPHCDARVTASRHGRPLGTLARKPLREIRKVCHAAFDPLWKQQGMTRTEAYRFLQRLMRLADPQAAHIGQFDERRCRELLERLQCHTCVASAKESSLYAGPSHYGSVACANYRQTGHGAIAAGGTVAHCTCEACF